MAEGAQGARHRPRITILVKLLAAFALPTSALFALFAVLAHEVTRRDLEAELGTRLAAVAASAATQIRGGTLAELQPGAEEHLLPQSGRRRPRGGRQPTGARRPSTFTGESAPAPAPAAAC